MSFDLDLLKKVMDGKNKVITVTPKNMTPHTVVRCGDNFYVFPLDAEDLAGKGGARSVRVAYLIDKNTGDYTMVANQPKKFIAKIFQAIEPPEDIQKEFEATKDYYQDQGVESPVKDLLTGKTYLVMDHHPGDVLFHKKESGLQVHPGIKNLTFSERVKVVQELMLAYNLLHHETTSGKAQIHGDIKGDNLHLAIEYDPAGKFLKANVYLFDFGNALSLPEENARHLASVKNAGGTLDYLPPEAMDDLRGVKSDIYALSALISVILGARNPFSDKDEIRATKENKRKMTSSTLMDILTPVAFNFDGMLCEGSAKPRPWPENYKGFDVGVIVHQFIDRMQAFKYQDRPDSDEVLRFFNILNKYCLTFDKDPIHLDSDALYGYGAQMTLMTLGWWKKEDNYDFHSNPQECFQIVNDFISLKNNPNATKEQQSAVLQKLRYLFLLMDDSLRTADKKSQLNVYDNVKRNKTKISELIGVEMYDRLLTKTCQTVTHELKSAYKHLLPIDREKAEAMLLLNLVMYKDNVAQSFFSNENKGMRKTLRRGALEQEAADILSYIEGQQPKKK